MHMILKYQDFTIKKSFFFLPVLLCLLFFKSGWTQVYPVQVNTQLIPPHSLKLSDYVTTQSDKFIANVLMTDINEYNRQLRFRLTIKGNGLTIRSNDFIIGANPVFADGGVPLRLTNIDLRPYFELQNLQGITPQQYNNPLPDGNYQFCLEVFDWVSGQRLSNPQLGCTNVYLIVNDPPFLNLPRKGDLVEAKNPQNIIFNWTPRHLNATNVQYEFELREIWDIQIDPQAAFLASPNLYQITTRNNTLLYGPGETPLLENKTYAWRVRALVSDGISETSVFRNNGYSEIFYFTYTADCTAPEFILAKSLSSDSEEITWQPNLDHQAYKVQYKKKGVRGAVWFDVNAINPQARIYNLEAGTTYEFRVGGQCMLPIANQEPRYSYSAVQEFTTPIKAKDSYYNCGIAPEIRISNKTPLSSLAANEVFTAGDFPVTVKQVDGENGVFSGIGFIVVPYLADTKIAVEFNNISINTSYQLYAGTIYTTYDANWSNVVDISGTVDAIAEIPKVVQELAQALDKTLDKIIASIKENINVNQQASIFIKLMQEGLDDPNNGLSIGEQDNLQKFINDKNKVKEAIEKAKQDIAEGKNDKIVKQNLVSSFVPESVIEEELLYDDKEYISKVFQQIRCAYVNNSQELPKNYFDKIGQEFSAKFDDYGTITIKLTTNPTKLRKINPDITEQTSGGGKKTSHYKLYTLDFGGVVITTKEYNELSHTEASLEKLQTYLFPENENAVVADYQKVLHNILTKDTFSDNDVQEIKNIANCGAQYFSVNNKYEIIKKVANHSFALTEYYEDLILDLIENYQGDVTTYSNAFLDKLKENPNLIQTLFNRIDNTGAQTFWKGNEDNFNRFLKIIYGLWLGSKYAEESNYTYVNELFDNGELTPELLTYDGKSWLPTVSYEPTLFTQTGVKIATETKYGRYGSLFYKYFQPIYIVFENGTKGKITKTTVPAIYFAGTAKKDNLEKSLDQIGLITDVALTLSAVGNFTKLKYLTNLQKLGRITIGTVEVTSATADILVRYTDLCEGNEAFCNAFQEYNTYLQLGLLGSGLLQAKFNVSRAKAKTAYEEQRNVLINKYGTDDARIKELDGHFGVKVANGLGVRFIAKSGDELKTFLNGITDLPAGKTYNGNMYRSLSKSSETNFGALPDKMTDHTVYSSWGRYDLDGAENAMYLSKTALGNQTEITHYGNWLDYNTYEFENVQLDNLLDLSDDVVRQKLGTQFDDLVRTVGDKDDIYEMTNVLASWARQKGYNGIIAPGARGSKNYENIILFNQSYIDDVVKGITSQKIIK